MYHLGVLYKTMPVAYLTGLGSQKDQEDLEGHSYTSGVARAFPGGRTAHPENQNEEENE